VNTFPRADMDPTQALAAPQAALMGAISFGVFSQTLDWGIVGIGAIIAVFFVLLDELLKAKGTKYRLPVLAVSLGLYLPLSITIPLAFGGLIAELSRLKLSSYKPLWKNQYQEKVETIKSRALLLASGLIAGEAIMGVLLAIPFAATQSTSFFVIYPNLHKDYSNIAGMIVFLGIGYWVYHVSTRQKEG